jgi:Domain of unknown function (DUF4338)
MEREVINIEPNFAKKKHHDEFLDFCRRVKRRTNKRTIEERAIYLLQEKSEVNRLYSGKSFHDNTDLAFMENLMIDLMLQDWEIIIQRNKIRLELEVLDDGDKNVQEEKAKTRRRHLLARDVQLKQPTVKDFIRSMEKRRLTTKGWQSIFSVMRDGNELSNLLAEANRIESLPEKLAYLNEAVRPYIQIVETGAYCQETGLLLSDIWRYFRHTWINEYKSLPGRSISILIRDAAGPNHPVIGIAALGSSVAQQTVRDKWIGWDGETFSNQLKNDPSGKLSKWLLDVLMELLREVYVKDFIRRRIITRKLINTPTKELVFKLRKLGAMFKEKHIDNPQKSKFTAENNVLNWSERAESYLFKSKRAYLLAELLTIRYIFQKNGFKEGTKKELERCLAVKEFSDAVGKLIRKAKSKHVGINMMDIIVCGSIAPYNHLLGGKLVCMMLMSPELNQYYDKKYNDATSLIASSMSGKPIVRKPKLVFLGTTSLYGLGSSQYNRIKIPAEEVGGITAQKIEYRELGISEGFGSFHFSTDTISLADAVVGRENGRTRVNSIFGEGANPLLRKLKDAFEYLHLESNPILNHRNKRVVYGVSLAENFGDVLLGLANRPKYFIQQDHPKDKSKLIGSYWIRRWLANRISNPEVLAQVAQHTLSYPITHGARVPVVEVNNELTLFD